ncbi:hypothetical protein PM3016_1339 [Paenibacillus mucilaginosus 3016]|uniref:Uncharacterized protein n=1 Tax=Paenibacillus mucilaginosus 3016 TaxID=1116391 RepID=H6NC74_9BACL|nr:hypothetical protein PM3016_1339 [Paenibacillus mucilaginosus 3016]
MLLVLCPRKTGANSFRMQPGMEARLWRVPLPEQATQDCGTHRASRRMGQGSWILIDERAQCDMINLYLAAIPRGCLRMYGFF